VGKYSYTRIRVLSTPVKPREIDTMRAFKTLCDAMGRPTIALEPSDCRHAVILSPGAPKSVSVPEGARVVVLSADGDFWCRIGGPAAVPTSDVLDGTASELNPICRSVAGVSVIGLAAGANRVVNLVFYSGGAS